VRQLGDEWPKNIKNNDINIYIYENTLKLLLEERREREKKSNPPIENCKTR
jgi:hypothetical protein